MSGLASAWKRWRDPAAGTFAPDALPAIPVAAAGIHTLADPADFRQTLLQRISQAKHRILLAALYLQDDEAGREVLAALYAAKAAQPQLHIAVFVDWHRAQRGLIGKAKSPGNAAMYKAMAQRFGPGVTIYGVPVQRREFMGVMHLKGFVIDDCVLYSGASLNDVYLQQHARYRLDRYHLIESRALADSLAGLLDGPLSQDAAVHPLNAGRAPNTADLRSAIVRFRRTLAHSRYAFASARLKAGEVGITPLLGLGTRDNLLNQTLLQLVGAAQKRLVLFTPYFNLPGVLRKAVERKIRAGCQVIVVLGDKTANDFYIPPHEPFKAIGALPYLYEANLRRFCKTHHKALAAGSLQVCIWRDGDNTFHLKGLLVDHRLALLTGNNLNPRAWRLDLENGLLLNDPHELLWPQHEAELAAILAKTERLTRHEALEAVADYPPPVQRLIRRLSRVRADRLVNQML